MLCAVLAIQVEAFWALQFPGEVIL